MTLRQRLAAGHDTTAGSRIIAARIAAAARRRTDAAADRTDPPNGRDDGTRDTAPRRT